ncbi:MAG TPA: endonuclease/exonuclease/phosphatase family protein [Gammaproteobacteria bacterium]
MLTVMTQNLNYYGDRYGPWRERRELVREAIEEAQPDIIALQAVCSDPGVEDGADQATQLSRMLPDYRHVFFYPANIDDDGREQGSAILSRTPVREPGVRELSLRPGLEDDNPRVIQHARFDLDKGMLSVFNAYFSWVQAQAADNIEEALAFLAKADGPSLLVGDFNMPADSPLLERLRDAGYVDLWMQAHPGEDGFTFEVNRPDRRIDYAWANEELARRLDSVELVRGERGGSGIRASDHFGLKISLAIQPAAWRPPMDLSPRDHRPGSHSM